MKCIRFSMILLSCLFIFSACSKSDILELEQEIRVEQVETEQVETEDVQEAHYEHRGLYTVLGDGNTETGEICTVDISLAEKIKKDEIKDERP